ncbi:MAG: lamin tail domain-containing protein, partial [Abitibacteriaceae bacterium]|nr:lamin tail domain-containing protein [Abditibacteriaceae bacterium]
YESAFDAVNNSLVVTTTADEDDGTSDPSFGTGTSLREAIEFANAYPGAAPITFNLPSGSTILLTSQLPALFDSVIGPGANQLTVRRSSADGTPSFGIFQVAASKTLTISGLTISNGNAGYGGGIYNAGNLTLTACVLSGNHADRGGAIYSAPPSGDATLFVRDCTFSGNTNGVGDPGFAYGGALFNYGTAVITNSTISGNNLFIPVNYNEAGSAIYNYGGPLTLDRCTVTNNGGTAQVVFSANGSASPITMRNSIIAGNQADTGTPTVDANFNLIGGTAQAAGLQTSTGVAILKNNGGPTPTVALRFGSPAIDAGDPNFDATNVPYDQRGVGFPRVFNNRLDIGAYEIQSVSNTAPTATGPTTFTATAGTGKTLTLVGGDVDNDPLSYTITTLPTNGILYDGPSTSGTAITTVPYTLTDPNHQVTYLAPTSYTGSDSFGFKVNDGTVDSNVQTVTGTVFPPVATTGAIISELRTRGPGGAGDEYVEIANTTSGPINVGGWFLAAPNGAAEATTTIPANTVIPKGGHLLFTGSTYSLTSYAVGDVTLTADLPDTGGVALRNGAGTPVDAVGFASAGALYKLGSGIAASIVGNGQNAFMRKQNGTPYVNSGDNASDFDFVAVTGGLVDGAAAKLGAPGPKSLSSPLLHNDILSAVALPVYRDTTAVGTNATYGTMAVRYKVTNNGSQTLTRLRFRAVMLPVGGAISGGTWQTSNGTADLRLLTSADTTATINGVSVPIKGSTLEEPPAQSNGGGLNSSMSLDLSGLAGGGLAAGASVNVQFNFGVVVKGTYRAVLNMEGLP